MLDAEKRESLGTRLTSLSMIFMKWLRLHYQMQEVYTTLGHTLDRGEDSSFWTMWNVQELNQVYWIANTTEWEWLPTAVIMKMQEWDAPLHEHHFSLVILWTKNSLHCMQYYVKLWIACYGSSSLHSHSATRDKKNYDVQFDRCRSQTGSFGCICNSIYRLECHTACPRALHH